MVLERNYKSPRSVAFTVSTTPPVVHTTYSTKVSTHLANSHFSLTSPLRLSSTGTLLSRYDSHRIAYSHPRARHPKVPGFRGKHPPPHAIPQPGRHQLLSLLCHEVKRGDGWQ